MHVVAVVVVCGTGAATAATVVELALAAGTGIGLGAELLEHFGVRPDFVERRVVHVARLFHHVGAGAHLPDGAHDAVVETGEATAAVTRLDIQLVRDAEELRGAGGLHGNAERAALFHNLAEQALVFGDAQCVTFNFLAATHGNEEENLVVHRTDFLDPVHDVENFVLVPVHDGRMNLERKARRLAVLDAHHREFARLLEFKGQIVRDERAVGAEHRTEPLARGMRNQFHDIGAGHGLAAAENHDLESGLGNLVNELERLGGREFSRLVLTRILVAVLARQVTLIRRHPRDNHAIDLIFFPNIEKAQH